MLLAYFGHLKFSVMQVHNFLKIHLKKACQLDQQQLNVYNKAKEEQVSRRRLNPIRQRWLSKIVVCRLGRTILDSQIG